VRVARQRLDPPAIRKVVETVMRKIALIALLVSTSRADAANDSNLPDYTPNRECYLSGCGADTPPGGGETAKETADRLKKEAEHQRQFEAWCWESSLFRMLNSDCPSATYRQRH